MMTKYLHLTIPLIIILLFSGCLDVCVSGSGKKLNRIRDVPSFTSISYGGSADLHITQDNSRRLLLSGDNNLHDLIETWVEDDVLYIRSNGCYIGKMEVYVTTDKIKSISNMGTGNIIADSTLTSDDLIISTSGPGKVTANVDAERLEVIISGPSTAEISGTANYFSYLISGSGRLSALDLEARDVRLFSLGSGLTEVWAVETLDATVSGSGVVWYKGSPQINKSLTGTGRIYPV